LTSDQPSIMDIAPSVLRLFGVPVPAHMDGRPIIADGAESETTDKGQPK